MEFPFLKIETSMKKQFLAAAALATTIVLASVENASSAATSLPLRYENPGVCTGQGITPLTIEGAYGNTIAGLAFSGTTNYDFYSPPITAAPALKTTDKGAGQLWMANGNSKTDFKVTVRFVFYDYNPASGTESQIADSGVTGSTTVKHLQAVEINTPQGNLSTSFTPAAGHLLHVRVAVTLASGTATNGYVLLNTGSGTPGDSIALLPAGSTKTWTFASPSSSASPVITAQPVSQSVCRGGAASLSLTATNATTYQWRKNGTNLSNGVNISGAATPRLTVSPTGTGDAASYDCLVSGASACGSVLSSAASLTLTAPPGNLAITAKSNSAVSLTFTGTPGIQYVVQATSTLAPPAWVNISTNIADPAGLIKFTDLAASHPPSRFYRAVGR
jgi:hypothetical protein